MSDAIQLLHGDCRKILPTLEARAADALVTDPPYGLGDLWRGGTGEWPLADNGRGVAWDARPATNVRELAERFGHAIIWGGHYFDLPPARGWLVWDKVVRNFTSGHCELAWTNLDQPVRAFSFAHGQLATEGKLHPTQKPLRLMEWCLSFLPEGCTVIDPYMGSGTTGVACVRTGRKFIGIEERADYFAIAERRIRASRFATPLFSPAPDQLPLFAEPP